MIMVTAMTQYIYMLFKLPIQNCTEKACEKHNKESWISHLHGINSNYIKSTENNKYWKYSIIYNDQKKNITTFYATVNSLCKKTFTPIFRHEEFISRVF